MVLADPVQNSIREQNIANPSYDNFTDKYFQETVEAV